MGEMRPPTLDHDHHLEDQNGIRSADLDSPEVWPELDAFLEKGEQLKELVTQLSKLVIKNADRP